MSYRQECGNYIFPNDKPLSIEIKIFKALTKVFYNKNGELTPNGKEAIENKIFPLSKPDVDNCAKSILDALNKVAYNDDKQIVSLTVTKEYDLQDSVMVSIEEYESNLMNG
jgi:Holliday junction resolvase RusA-like endonuclease